MPKSPFFCLVAMLAILLINAPTLHAELKLSDYKRFSGPEQEKKFEQYIRGLGEGMSWSTAISNQKKQPLLYCVPSDLALNSSNYKRILDDEIKRSSHAPDVPVGLLLIQGLMATFPCDTE